MLTDADRSRIRDEIGSTPDDPTIEEWHDELGDWILVALRVLKRRRADATAGGQEVSSFSLDGVLSVGLSRANLASLNTQIANLEALLASDGTSSAYSARISRPDRHR